MQREGAIDGWKEELTEKNDGDFARLNARRLLGEEGSVLEKDESGKSFMGFASLKTAFFPRIRTPKFHSI